MKKILIATTALVATAGFAHAEVAVSGSAIAGIVYNSEAVSKTRVLSKANVIFDATGESDGGLQFGFNTNHIVTNNATVDNDDTTVFLKGAFGKLSFGAVGEADEVAGLSDIGWDGLDVDDVAEALVGDELGDVMGAGISHNVNYTYATGPISLSLSGKLGTSHASSNDSYAVGAKYSFGNGYVGLGYGDHEFTGLAAAKVVSLFGGATFDAIKVSAIYSDGNLKNTVGGTKFGAQAYGLNASYTMDALTVSMGYGKAKFDANTMGIALKQQSFGIGAAYDLGGGASISGGIARVESVGDENLSGASAKVGASSKETRADLGVKFSF
jgi:outer membrane protein OmpU